MGKLRDPGPGVIGLPRLIGKVDGLARVIEIEDSVSLGRHPSNDVPLSDKTISKQHCVVERRGADFWVRDLDSKGGTWVNGSRVTDECLWPGDVLSLGSLHLHFFSEGDYRDDVSRGQRTVVYDGVQTSQPPIWFDGLVAELQPITPAEVASADACLPDVRQRLESRGVAQAVVNGLLKTLRADAVTFFLPDELGLLEARASARRDGGEEPAPLPPGLIERVAKKGRGMISNDLKKDAVRLQIGAPDELEVRAALAMPMLQDRKVRGVLVVDRRKSAKPLTVSDAKVVARALDRVGLRLLPPKPGVN